MNLLHKEVMNLLHKKVIEFTVKDIEFKHKSLTSSLRKNAPLTLTAE
jgi:hypothetical protein